jgi:hypothetical protein
MLRQAARSKMLGRVTELTLITPVKQGFVADRMGRAAGAVRGSVETVARRSRMQPTHLVLERREVAEVESNLVMSIAIHAPEHAECLSIEPFGLRGLAAIASSRNRSDAERPGGVG